MYYFETLCNDQILIPYMSLVNMDNGASVVESGWKDVDKVVSVLKEFPISSVIKAITEIGLRPIGQPPASVECFGPLNFVDPPTFLEGEGEITIKRNAKFTDFSMGP